MQMIPIHCKKAFGNISPKFLILFNAGINKKKQTCRRHITVTPFSDFTSLLINILLCQLYFVDTCGLHDHFFIFKLCISFLF